MCPSLWLALLRGCSVPIRCQRFGASSCQDWQRHPKDTAPSQEKVPGGVAEAIALSQ